MPWKVSTQVDQRKKLIYEIEQGVPIAHAAKSAGVSRKTAYKWWERHKQSSEEDFEDREPYRGNHPLKTPKDIEDRILACYQTFPNWGPKKLKAWLERREPSNDWPSATTFSNILRRKGIAPRRRRRRRTGGFASATLITPSHPNHVWSVDFKGDFLLGDRTRCYPFTVTDNFSRKILRIECLRSTQSLPVEAIMDEIFAEFGCPEAIRSDGGVPFFSNGFLGISSLNLRFLSLGIQHERIACPQQNGRHERMHSTYKKAVCRPPAYTLSEQQRRSQAFVDEFNSKRPHEALDFACPDDLYIPSKRRLQDVDFEWSYPECEEVRYVNRSGNLRFRGHSIFFGKPFSCTEIGLTEIAEGIWEVHIYGYILGLFELSDRRVLGLGRGQLQPLKANEPMHIVYPHVASILP